MSVVYVNKEADPSCVLEDVKLARMSETILSLVEQWASCQDDLPKLADHPAGVKLSRVTSCMYEVDLRPERVGWAARSAMEEIQEFFRRCAHKVSTGDLRRMPIELFLGRERHEPQAEEGLWLYIFVCVWRDSCPEERIVFSCQDQS